MEFMEAIRKLREEMEKQEGEKMSLLEKILDPTAKGEGKANTLRNESDILQEEVTTVETPIAPKTIDFILRVNITENTQNKK
jgi:hypothetical protein